MNDRFGGYVMVVRTTILLAVIGLVYLLLPKSLFHSFNCESAKTPSSFSASNGFFIDNQLIFIGPRDEVGAAIAALTPPVIFVVPGTPTVVNTPVPIQTPVPSATPLPSGTPVASNQPKLRLIEDCDLSYLNTRQSPDPELTEQQRKTLVMRLYEIPTDSGFTVEEVIRQITLNPLASNISIDPNYLVSRSANENDPCGRPESQGGSGGGKDFGDPGVLDPTFYDAVKAANAFKVQWAFTGINIPATAAFTGDGVRVAVIDSSPFRLDLPFYRRIGIALPSPLWFKIRDTAASRNILSSHGMFVAELIHHVSPRSKIDLIHVLDDQGCTRLMPLMEALNAYISRRSAWTGDMNKTVINMSLGIRVPNPPKSTPTEEEKKLIENLKTFEDIIEKAHRLGAVMVAAAGNDSNQLDDSGTLSGLMPMQIPANSLNVIGVSATDPTGKLSCYSNIGDVAAPGGNGGVNPDNSAEICVPRTDSKNVVARPGACIDHDLEHCQYGVISLALTDTGPQYVFWSGTSFSTPLVSGLAALAYQKWDQKTVECLIEHGVKPVSGGSATTPKPVEWGLMDINKALTDTGVLTTCGVTP